MCNSDTVKSDAPNTHSTVTGPATTRRTGIEKLRTRLKYRTLLLEGFNRLYRATGFLFSPYYIFRGYADSQQLESAKIVRLECRRLTKSDMNDAARLTEKGEERCADKALELSARMGTSLGFGAFVDGSLVGYCWAELIQFRIPIVNAPLFVLRDDEASAYDFLVAPEYRGKRIGPAMRQAMYDALALEGRSCTYRTIGVFNRPSLRVAAKSTAERVETRLTIGFPRFFAVDLTLGHRTGARGARIMRARDYRFQVSP